MEVDTDNTKYKVPKTIKEQIEYLSDNKKVIFNEMEMEKYEVLLHKRNYINLISPFKHKFAKSDESDEYMSIRDEKGNHIYENDTDLLEYSLEYEDEREKYPIYYDGIAKFESAFKSVVGHKFLLKYNVINKGRAIYGFDVLLNNLESLEIDSFGSESDIRVRKSQMKNSLVQLKNKLHNKKKKYEI